MSVWFAKLVRYDPILSLVLAGMLVSTLFQSGMSIVKFAADADDKLPTITFWLMGSFSRIDRHDLAVALLPMLMGFAILVSQSWKLNVLSFGKELNPEAIINTGPQLILSITNSSEITQSDIDTADDIQEKTGIPCIVLRGGMDGVVDLYQRLGDLLGREDDAKVLSD